MNSNESDDGAGMTPAPAVASALSQSANPERRARRSARMHTAFQAIKAQHSGGQSRMQIIADWLTNLGSSTGFFLFHVVAFTAWILLNSGIAGIPAYDPFPFGLLTMIVSLEAIFLSIFVLMSQSRESKIGELREELTLQVNLRIEEEVTKTLHLVAGLYTRLGHTIGEDPELREMLKPLDPERMEREVTDQIHAAIPRLKFRKKKASAR